MCRHERSFPIHSDYQTSYACGDVQGHGELYERCKLEFLFSGLPLKRIMIHLVIYSLALLGFVSGSPTQDPLSVNSNKKFYDVQVHIPCSPGSRLFSLAVSQAHRGGRGNTVESILPSFAWYSDIDGHCLHPLPQLCVGDLLTAPLPWN